MLKIYGWKRSRAARCMWVMEEMSLDYEQVPLNPHAGETRTPEYLALNPSGKIPTLVHDDFVLAESMAINWYLASSFPGTLLPRDPRHGAKIQQWTLWAITELEPPVVAIMREGRRPQGTDRWRQDRGLACRHSRDSRDGARAAPQPSGVPASRQHVHARRSQRGVRRQQPAGIRYHPGSPPGCGGLDAALPFARGMGSSPAETLKPARQRVSAGHALTPALSARSDRESKWTRGNSRERRRDCD